MVKEREREKVSWKNFENGYKDREKDRMIETE